MLETNGMASFSNGKKIRVSQHFTIDENGKLHISQDFETPERAQQELKQIVAHGVELVELTPRKRGVRRKRAKRTARRRK